MNDEIRVQWMQEPEEHNYPAAKSFLSLLYDEATAERLVDDLKRSKIEHFKAKDIFRASGLSLLGVSNSHVAKDQGKIRKGKMISPILLVRENSARKLIIADGYHRLCAVYTFDEDELIPCKIV